MDVLKISITEDGRIKIETDNVSAANHMTAEAFLRTINQTTGGESKQTRKAGFHSHSHSHGTLTHTH